jgi:demethylmenaquinone methyltransferase/2-methoxy-6-polyprenyl-1,4-benzoquinol methylase
MELLSMQAEAAEVRIDKSSQAVRAMFGDIARSYDWLNHVLSGNQDKRWRRRAIRLLAPRAGQLILDLCCGTGDLTLECLRQQPNIRIIGADFAVPMLQIAQQKSKIQSPKPAVEISKAKVQSLKKQASEAEIQNSEFKTQNSFVAGDGLCLPFGDATFDAITVGFGVRNFQDTEAGLQEMFRLIKPGGKVLILEFMRPVSPLVQRAFGAFNYVLAPLGRAVSGHATAYNYLPQSIGGFYTRREFTQLLRRVGFRNVRSFDYSLGVATAFVAHKPL